ncbi:hypothetical protein Pfo_025285 [Paulownia fortunei]|nr:hypothetical protein Pfo_025285 [Paulownia fortunei]
MAKSCATIIALFCLFTLSLAHTAPEHDEVTTQVSLPLSEASPMLRLPSGPVNTETESNSTVVTTVPLTKLNTETESNAAVVTSAPLIKSTFRPVNRRFHVRSKHPCRHHVKVQPTMGENEVIPYGNDMIVSSGENSDFEDPVLHGEGRSVPGRWVRLHHHHHDDEDSDSDEDEDEDQVKKIVFKRYDHNSFDREKELKVLKKLRKHFRHQNGEEEKKKKGGFMKRVRKFLDQYF